MTIAQSRRRREMIIQLQLTALGSQGSAQGIREQVRQLERDD